ncbi:Hypothetical predicted protein [Olea europaea subsp. europaea]|uniref:Uncharacterized protein n=1 Tax=Olea europaea subsp. europaea TaxID=158383 RepID=A0A8S0QHT8_OLEEU|nr:Hypothetical predicted protein [Olea europaea subsp. europaea]
MTSTIWNTTAFNVDSGGFSNNVNRLARCLCSVITGSGFVKLEREYQQKCTLLNGHVVETFDHETENSFSAETGVKSTMQLFIKFSTGIIFESWNESNR